MGRWAVCLGGLRADPPREQGINTIGPFHQSPDYGPHRVLKPGNRFPCIERHPVIIRSNHECLHCAYDSMAEWSPPCLRQERPVAYQLLVWLLPPSPSSEPNAAKAQKGAQGCARGLLFVYQTNNSPARDRVKERCIVVVYRNRSVPIVVGSGVCSAAGQDDPLDPHATEDNLLRGLSRPATITTTNGQAAHVSLP